MSFVNRLRNILLERNREEIESVQRSIDAIYEKHSQEYERVQKLKEESEEANKQKNKVQKTILDKKNLEDLKTIYSFVSNYRKIEAVLGKIKDIQLKEIDREYIFYLNENELFDADMNRRYELYETVKKLNAEIIEALEADEEDLAKKEIEADEEDEKGEEPAKKSFFSRFFGGKKDEDKSNEKALSKEKNLFKKYKRTVQEFERKYNSFLIADFEEALIIDKATSTRIATTIKSLSTIKKRGGELFVEEEIYLQEMQPHELWQEISRYYANINDFVEIVEKFEKNIDKFQKLYKQNPSLFELEHLEIIFEENDQKIEDLKLRNREATSKKSEVIRKKQSERELKAQLKEYEDKKKKLQEKASKIEKADTLQALGFKSKEDAAKKLSIETLDYVVIPIPNKIRKISELFYEEKILKVDTDGKTFYASYINETATGRINSIESIKDVESALLIPIAYLKKEDIDSVKSGKICLNKSVLNSKNLLTILPNGKYLDFEGADVEIERYSYGSIFEKMKRFLGEDYLEKSDGISDYTIFKGISSISSQEKRNKREAVKKCVLENIKRSITSEDIININGKPFFLNKEDEKEIRGAERMEPLNTQFLEGISDEIETYLIEGEDHGAKIDQFYKKLLLEYMRVNRKAKADYYDEDNTKIVINGKKISIKPILPAQDEKIAERYSRSREDVIYKTMKLANLVNKFAHMAETPELRDTLYNVKLDLIERAIDLSNNNSKVNLKRKFDADKMVMSVMLEIPSYNMVALHIMNKSNALTHKSNRLEVSEEDVLQTSAIFMPGVNKEFLTAMKNMDEKERMKTLVDMDSSTFSKLVLRMGYTSESISTEESKKSFIRKLVSDKKIAELLKEDEEIER